MTHIQFRIKWQIFAALLLAAWLAPAQQPSANKMDTFAKCVAKKNAVMFGSAFCSHCDEQRKLFGDSFRFIHYVECSREGAAEDVSACKSAQVRFTPTWIFSDSDRLLGVQPLKTLGERTGCALP